MEEKRLLIFSGDIHGNLKGIVWKISIQYQLRNVDLIIAGDFGVGFGAPSAMDVQYNSVKDRLEKYDINIYVVRGNHDDPSYFDGKHDYSRLKFLEDHKIYDICGKKIYPVGGAHSVDRVGRIDENNDYIHYGSSRRCWWENEPPIKNYKNLPDNVDIVVSHEAPISFEPVVVRETEDLKLWNDILDARNYLNYILNHVKISWWIHGHYHRSSSGNYGNVKYRGLSIEELFYLPEEEI